MEKSRAVSRPHNKIIFPVLVLTVLGLALILFDRQEISRIIQAAEWRVLPGAVFVVFIGQGSVTWSYVILTQVMQMRMPRAQTAAVYFTTNVMNRVIRSFGAAGFSVRCLIMKQYGVEISDALNSSFLHFLLGSLVMLGLLPPVMLYVILFAALPPGLVSMLAVLAVLGFAGAVCVGALLFGERLRWKFAGIAIWLAKKVMRRDATDSVRQLAERASLAVTVLRQDRLRFSAVVGLLVAEWAANVILLGLCLRAFGAGVDILGAAAIFALGTLAGVITAIPGGIGVQETVMTSLAVSLGISFEQAVLATLLYRVLQTFLPYLISLILYPRLLSQRAAPSAPKDVRI